MNIPVQNTIIVRYGEIGLKRGNREYFEHKLFENIKFGLGDNSIAIHKVPGQIIITLPDPQILDSVVAKLKKVFGIVWLAPVFTLDTNFEVIEKFIIKLAKEKLTPKKSFAVRVIRRSKNFPATSVEIEKKLGSTICSVTDAKVKLDNPDITFHIIFDHQKVLIYTDKIAGPGGLPVGTSGRVLSLLSGGFDSIASSYLLSKRGADVDFVHFHIFTNHEHVMTTKIKTLVDKLGVYTKTKSIYLASYLPFQLKTINLPEKYARYELIVFRRLIHKVAQKLSQAYNYQALVTGDSLGQVASQTMENIVAVDDSVTMPIFRPLIGTDKTDIINLVRSIDLEEEAVAPYKDCCSIVSQNPATHANIILVKELEEYIELEKIVDEIVSGVGRIKLR